MAVLDLGAGENRLHADSTDAILALLDEVETDDYTALVTTAQGRIWCNGYDAPWCAAHPDRCAETIQRGERLFARLLAFPLPTVAALQGHAFAAGFFVAMAHDVRVLRADRGYLCLPEVTFGAIYTSAMNDFLVARLSPQVAHRAIVLGHRFSATEALAHGLIEYEAPLHEVMPQAVAVAEALGGRDQTATAALKRQLYARPLTALGSPPTERLVNAVLALGSRTP